MFHRLFELIVIKFKFKVEVVDPLAAEILDMDVISDVFKPSQPSVFDHIFGFFYGIRRRGIQETEKMLRKDVIITGIGELVFAKDGKVLRLQPPENRGSFYLTTMSVTSLLKKLEDSRRNYRFVFCSAVKRAILFSLFRLGCILCGAVGLVIGSLIVRKYLNQKKLFLEEQKRKEELEINRRERRKKIRDQDIPENQLCVVCRTNPREVFFTCTNILCSYQL